MLKLLTIAFAFCLGLSARADSDFPALNEAEKRVIAEGNFEAEIFLRKNIVLAWPKDRLDIVWEESFGIKSVAELATFTDKFFEKLAAPEVFNFNPQIMTDGPAWTKSRLVITFFYKPLEGKWSGCWQSANKISYCNPFDRNMGTRDWFGTLAHEIVHYFGALHFNSTGYIEGIADFMRYQSNLLLGWKDLAEKLRETYYNKCFASGLPRYHGAAGSLLELYEKKKYRSIQDFIVDLKANDYRNAFPPFWEFFTYPGLRRSTIHYCRETRTLRDRSGSSVPLRNDFSREVEERFQNEVAENFWGLAYLKQFLESPAQYLRPERWEQTRQRLVVVQASLQKYTQLLGQSAPNCQVVVMAMQNQSSTSAGLVADAKLELDGILTNLSIHSDQIFAPVRPAN